MIYQIIKLLSPEKVLNLDYARLLAQNKALSLEDIMALDKVQKRKPLRNQDEKKLRRKKLIEGRKPNYFIACRSEIGRQSRLYKK